jgi:serine/threonine protein phosphatase PrpC
VESQQSSGPRIEAAAATHIGRRDTNADAVLLDDAACFYAVTDGIGDTPRSGLVARMALDAVRELFQVTWTSCPPTERSVEEARRRLVLGITQAHGRLYVPGRPREARLGTTFASVVVCGEQLCTVHVGDSRVYLLGASQGRLTQITRDHTVGGDASWQGMPHEAGARLPGADVLTQAIGARSRLVLQAIVRRWEPGDIALVCTDGLSDRLEDDVIRNILLDASDLGKTAQRLVDVAIDGGGWDNATAALVRWVS